jgi:hypothetical protein
VLSRKIFELAGADDHIESQAGQIGDEFVQALWPAAGETALERDCLSFYVAECSELLEERVPRIGLRGIRIRPARQQTDSRHSLLRPGGERRGKSTGQRGQQEAAAVHAGMVGRTRAKVNQRRCPGPVLKRVNVSLRAQLFTRWPPPGCA